MIMAAGLGTRLRPFTETTPKSLLPLMGIPLIQWSFDAAKSAGCKKAVINLHHLGPALKAGVAGLDVGAMEIVWSDETREILGSGGGIAHAIPKLGERFYVLNSDTVCPLDLNSLGEQHLRLRNQGVLATLALKRRPADSAYAGIEARENRVGKFRSAKGSYFYVGAGVFERSLFKAAPGGSFDLVEQVLAAAAAQGAIAFVETEEPFLDIGTPEQWARAHFEVMRAPKKFPRVQTVCSKLPNDVWALKNSTPPASAKGPAFWGVTGAGTGDLGPFGIVYDPSSAPPWKQGLWYGGHSVSLSPSPSSAQSPRRGKP